MAAGDEGDAKVYMRYAIAPNGVLCGFEFRYPRAKADALDRVSVAMSNAFDANPSAQAPTPAASASQRRRQRRPQGRRSWRPRS